MMEYRIRKDPEAILVNDFAKIFLLLEKNNLEWRSELVSLHESKAPTHPFAGVSQRN